MSSLAAARADNFYYPEDFDPKTHRTLNRYHGQHALRDRALADGGLVVRFEVPFPLCCLRCGESIGKGVRFNAAKRQEGMYHSTKVWRFEMTHHCGSAIVVRTDPANADYAIVSGARRRAAPGRAQLGEGEDEDDDGGAAAAAAARLASDEALLGPSDAVPRDHAVGREKPAAAARGADPMAALERSAAAARRAAERLSRLEALERRSGDRHASGNGLALNRALRGRMRGARHEEKGLEAQRRRMGVSEAVRLLPSAREDGEGARRAMAASAASAEDPERRRQRILSEPIFGFSDSGPGLGSGGGGGGVAAALAAERENTKKRPPPSLSKASAAPKKPAAVAAWAPPLARAPKRR